MSVVPDFGPSDRHSYFSMNEHTFHVLAGNAPTEATRLARKARLKLRTDAPKTTKPCPGCGVSASSRRYGRPATEVCDQCLIDLWSRQDALHEQESRAVEGERHEMLIIPSDGDWPRTMHGIYLHAGRHAPLDELQRAVAGLLKAALRDGIEAVPERAQEGRRMPTAKPASSFGYSPGALHRAYRVLAPKGVAEAIDAIEATLEPAIAYTFQAGVDEGRSLLRGLASGAITSDEFDSGKKRR